MLSLGKRHGIAKEIPGEADASGKLAGAESTPLLVFAVRDKASVVVGRISGHETVDLRPVLFRRVSYRSLVSLLQVWSGSYEKPRLFHAVVPAIDHVNLLPAQISSLTRLELRRLIPGNKVDGRHRSCHGGSQKEGQSCEELHGVKSPEDGDGRTMAGRGIDLGMLSSESPWMI